MGKATVRLELSALARISLPTCVGCQELPPGTVPHYRLHSFEDFRRYIIDADIKLVRPQYLRELLQQGRIFPRRQEAEAEPGALFKPTENDNFRVVTISHSWESMEHPDPCGFQLKQIVRRIDLDIELEPIFKLGHIDFSRTDVFFFIDFVCLYQYKRENPGRSMNTSVQGLCLCDEGLYSETIHKNTVRPRYGFLL